MARFVTAQAADAVTSRTAETPKEARRACRKVSFMGFFQVSMKPAVNRWKLKYHLLLRGRPAAASYFTTYDFGGFRGILAQAPTNRPTRRISDAIFAGVTPFPAWRWGKRRLLFPDGERQPESRGAHSFLRGRRIRR